MERDAAGRAVPCLWAAQAGKATAAVPAHACELSFWRRGEACRAIPSLGCHSTELAGVSSGHPAASPQPDLSHLSCCLHFP